MRNQHKLKGCIVKGYIAKEAIKFYSDYLLNAIAIEVPTSLHKGKNINKAH